MAQIILAGAPCAANALRTQLRHSWLANQILNKSESDVVFLWQHGSWTSLYSEFDTRLDDAQRLAAMIEPGFSPALLVDSLSVFSGMDAQSRADLKQAVHSAYVSAFRPADLLPPYEKAVMELKVAINTFRQAWDVHSDASDYSVTESWSDVLECAKVLEKLLDSLPKGIVLP